MPRDGSPYNPRVKRRNPPPRPPDAEIDLHGLTPDAAFRRLQRGLHSARVCRQGRVLVITGQGFGNAAQKPVLRQKVESFLRGADGARLGVVSFELAARGGALLVTLRVDGTAREDDDEWADED